MPERGSTTRLPSPYQAGAPWPCMRANLRNTGESPIMTAAAGFSEAPALTVRRWRTGNGVFSTPIIGRDETIYVGSADKHFYAFDPVSGRERWKFATGECIDSAGCIAADGTIYFASCDAGMYGLSPSGEERWRLNLFEKRTHFTPSTIFWWEGNVVLGPNELLYAGNDDFNFYAIEPGRGVRWAYLTGLHIWGAPAFGDDGAVYFTSFDCNCYALDRSSGAVRWRTDTGNFVVSSPAIAPDGAIHFGSFDGHVYALEPDSGHIRWRIPTGGPIYASPAIAADGTLYIGSSDGCLYAIDTNARRVRWSFYTGDAIRSSAAIGPDPEGTSPYLVYFGGGNGLIYALDPEGRRRWSLSTLREGAQLDSPNINASIALGRAGLATAAANGDVFYVPYHYYLSTPDAAELDRSPDDGYPHSGNFLYAMSPGGAMATEPLSEATAPMIVEPSQTMSMRLLARRDGRTVPARVDPNALRITLDPPRPFRVSVQPDGSQINIIPQDPGVATDTGSVTIEARFEAGGERDEVAACLPYRFLPAANAPSIEALVGLPFRITHMSIYDPVIVPSFDQIGIASLTIQARIIDVDAQSGKVVGWGLKKFGIAEDGGAVQVAIPRHLYYAFSGRYENGRLLLTAKHCNFELTAFPVPLDLIRFSGTWDGAEGPCLGASLVAELDIPARFRLFAPAKAGAAEKPNAAPLSRLTSLPWSQLATFVRTWMPDVGSLLRSLPLMLRSVARAVPQTLRLLHRDMYGPWGLIGEDGWFRGVGSFHSRADIPADVTDVRVSRFDYDRARHRIVAEIASGGGEPRAFAVAVPGLVVVDRRTCEPLALRYDSATTIRRQPRQLRIELGLPASVARDPGRWQAYLLLDVTPLGEITLGSGES